MFKLTITMIAILSSLTTFACTVDGNEGFLPENNQWISTSIKNTNPMNEEIFNSIIENVNNIYGPIVINDFQSTLIINGDWESGRVNARAHRSINGYEIDMLGGLARHEKNTPDGFTMVLCHELGHHIGGAPKKTGRVNKWATNDGQADYFASLKCLRRLFDNDNNQEIVARLNVPAEVKNACDSQFNIENDSSICQRSAMAGMALANVMHSITKKKVAPQFNTPDPKVVRKTYYKHPKTQCRLDTYYAGALCAIDFELPVHAKDEAQGVCYRSSGDDAGTRPLCWFKALN